MVYTFARCGLTAELISAIAPAARIPTRNPASLEQFDPFYLFTTLSILSGGKRSRGDEAGIWFELQLLVALAAS